MNTTLPPDAAVLDERTAADPASAPLLHALRARATAIVFCAPDAVARQVTPAGAGPKDAADSSRSMVVTAEIDAIRRAKQAGFGFVVGIAAGSEAERSALREAGADLVAATPAGLSLDDIDAWFANRVHARPPIPSHREEIAGNLAGRRPVLFLDYDGTLTPIVARPEMALLDPGMRALLSDLAGICPTVIVSGRGREDVARMVGIADLVYAGSHGFDIAGAAPGRPPIRHRVAADLQPLLRRAAEALAADLGSIPGILVEDKRFAVTVHYRQVAEDRVEEIEAAVDRVLAAAAPPDGQPPLKKTSGKKVLELRPAVQWDKGRAVLWLMQALGVNREKALPIYVGDDATDEDAFLALRDRGITALVSRTPRPTAARYSLQDCAEVGDFLRFIASRGALAGGPGTKLA